jgi:hypothetical protein
LECRRVILGWFVSKWIDDGYLDIVIGAFAIIASTRLVNFVIENRIFSVSLTDACIWVDCSFRCGGEVVSVIYVHFVVIDAIVGQNKGLMDFGDYLQEESIIG